jgi:hypothetical protein
MGSPKAALHPGIELQVLPYLFGNGLWSALVMSCNSGINALLVYNCSLDLKAYLIREPKGLKTLEAPELERRQGQSQQPSPPPTSISILEY